MSKSLEELHNAIMAGTLSDAESIHELRYRRANFATDDEMRPELRAHGLAVFDNAINTVVPMTVAINSPVVRVLQNVLTEIGRLLVENESRKEVDSDEDEEDGEDAQSGSESCELSEPLQDDFLEVGDPLESNSEGTSLATVVGAREKTKSRNHSVPEKVRETRQSSKKSKDIAKGTSPFTQPTKITPKNQQSSQPPLGVTPQPSSRKKGKGKFESLGQHDWLEEEEHQMPSPKKSLIVKLKTPKLRKTLLRLEKDRAHSADAEQVTQKKSLVVRLRVPKLYSPSSQDEAHMTLPKKRRHANPVRQRRKRQKRVFKSAEYIISDNDTSSIESTSNAELSVPTEPGVLTQLSEPMEASVPTEPSVPTASPSTTPRCVGLRMFPASSECHYSSSSSTSTPTQHHKLSIGLRPASAIASSTSASSSSSSSLSTPPSPAAVPTSPAIPAFPPIPSQRTEKYLLAFQKGAYIALENILEDHAADPELSLFELLGDLEENKPTVDDWERKTILRGAEWVYGALRKWLEDFGVVNGEGEGEGESEEELEEKVEDDVSMVGADEESESMREIARGVDFSTLEDHDQEEADGSSDMEESEQSQSDEEEDGLAYEIEEVVQELQDWAEKQFESEHKRLASGKKKVVPEVRTPEE